MAFKILYIEDARAFHRIMQRMLADICTLMIVETLDDGWAEITRERPDLIICDFQFPEGDALPLIFKIRKQYTAQELPIIMLTSAVDKVSIGKFHESGVNTAVRKIPQADQFHDLVYRMLRKPWVDVPEVTVGDAHLLTWTTAEGTHVFCPNLQLLKVAATPEVALAMMQEALAKHLASQGSVPAIGSPKLTVTYPGKKVASGNVTEMPAVTPVPDAVGQ